MKTRNQFLGLIAIAIIAITALSMTGCEDDLCKCPNGTEHLFGQPCCDGTDCKCVVYYGTLPNTTIKIYKGDASVTDGQATAIATKVIGIYNDPSFVSTSGQLAGKIDSILVVSGSSAIKNGRVLVIGCNAADSDIVTLLVTTAVS